MRETRRLPGAAPGVNTKKRGDPKAAPLSFKPDRSAELPKDRAPSPGGGYQLPLEQPDPTFTGSQVLLISPSLLRSILNYGAFGAFGDDLVAGAFFDFFRLRRGQASLPFATVTIDGSYS